MNLNFKYFISFLSILAVLTGCEEEKLQVSINFDQSSYEMVVGGETLDLASKLTIENSDETAQFESSDNKIAKVNKKGVVTAVSKGQATITATVQGKSATCTIVVSEMAATSLAMNCESTVLEVGEVATITAIWEPEAYDPANLEWSYTSNPEGIVEFTGTENSVRTLKFIEYKAPATAEVTVKDKVSGKTANMTLAAKEPVVVPQVVRINLNESKLFKKVGDEQFQLVATCYDENNQVVEGYDELEWSATKEEGIVPVEVVQVSQTGLVTFLRKGISVVKVVNKNNPSVEAICTITVSAADILVKEIRLSPSSQTITSGEKFQISALVLPEDANDKSLTYTSSDKTIAVVSEAGLVEGVAEGKAEITVTSVNGVSAVCYVTVSNSGQGEEPEAPAVESVTLDTENKIYRIPQLETMKVIAYYGPAGSAPKTTSWSSSDETLATVDSEGNVTAVAPVINEEVETWVTITHIADGKSANISLQIIRALPKTIRISSEPEGKKLYMGESFTYKATVEPDLARQEVMWMLMDSEGTSIQAGMGFNTGELRTGYTTTAGITIGVGKYTIRAKASANENVVAYTELEILPIDMVSASLNYESVTLSEGGYVNLSVTFNPSNTTFKDVEWKSSDERVATVNNEGKVTAIASGNAEITATLHDGTILKCLVTVESTSVNVGDFFYSDGTWSTELDPTKTPVGIVFSIDNATLHDMKLAADHSGCTHGIVVSLKETAPVKWQGWRSKVSEWAVSHGFMPIMGVKYDNVFSLNGDGMKLCGYNNTAAIKAYMQSDEYANGGDDVKISLFDNESQMPEVAGTSGWYIPSVAEMNEIAANAQLLQKNIQLAGGDAFATGYEVYHWTSTEGVNYDTAVCVRLDTGVVTYNRQKGKSQNVRYVFAF